MRAIEIEYQYNPLTESHKNGTTINQSNIFRYLEILILYLPMWSSKSQQNGKVKQRCYTTINSIISTFIAVLTICAYGYILWAFFIPNLTVSRLFDAMAFLFFGIAKLIGIYYYYHKFNYPWHFSPPKVNKPKDSHDMRRCNKIIILLFVCAISADIASSTIQLLCFQRDTWQINLFWIIWKLTHLYPLHVSQCVVAVIFFKYHVYIKHITRNMDNKCNIKDIFIQYKILYKSYKIDYCKSLRYQIYGMFIGIGIWFWYDTYLFLTVWNQSSSPLFLQTILWIIKNILIFIMVLLPGNILAESFHAFETRLWDQSEQVMDKHDLEKDNQNVIACWNYVINYVRRCPLDGKIFHISFTRKNVMKLVCTFITAKLISYSIKYIANYY